MNIVKYILLELITSFTFFLGISTKSHLYLLQQTFNTKLFNLNNVIILSNVSFILCIIYKSISQFLRNNKISKLKHIKFKNVKYIIIISTLNTFIYYIIPHKIKNLKILAISFIILSLVIILSTNKKGTKKIKEIAYLDSIIIGISPIISFIPTISPVISNLLFSKIRKLNKNSAIYLSFISILPILLIEYIKYKINNFSTSIFSIIIIILTFIFSLKIFDIFKNIYLNNKTYKISIYCLIISIFILYWFR